MINQGGGAAPPALPPAVILPNGQEAVAAAAAAEAARVADQIILFLDNVVTPPAECPLRFKELVNKWDVEAANLLRMARVPWSVMAKMAGEEWTTTKHLQ